MNERKPISIIVPIYNEQPVISHFFERMTNVLDGLREKYCAKVIRIDDGSTDNSWNMIRGKSMVDGRYNCIRLSRNFGHQAALSCGYEFAQGDAVISIDADLQDPPEVIPELIQQWERGNHVVLTDRRKREGEKRMKVSTANVFYKIISRMSETEAPEGICDYRLLDRVAVPALKNITETHRYIRGLVGWLGFKRVYVEYDRSPRHAGITKYSLGKMIRLAIDGIVSLSFWPLRAAYFAAIALMIPFLLYLVYNFVLYSFFNISMVPGWSFLILAVILFGAFNLLMLGILGEYTGRIYSEVKRRPIFLVEEYCGHAGIEIENISKDK